MTLFKKAAKTQSRLRLALVGPSGSGKTYSALAIATGLGGRIAVIDTERGSASKYADEFTFDALEMELFSPRQYVQAINAAAAEGYDVLVIDSLSHAWMGKGGALEMVDNATARSNSRNSYVAWREVTPEHNALVDAIVQSKCHVIATMRSKTEYVLEQDDKGRMTPRKVGLAPIQRDGLEYEFDVVADMDLSNRMIVSKSRCKALSGQVINKPGADVAETLRRWLSDGAPQAEPKIEPTAATTPSANGHTEPPAPAEYQPVSAVNRAAVSGLIDQLARYQEMTETELRAKADAVKQLVTATNDQLSARGLDAINPPGLLSALKSIAAAAGQMIDYDARAPVVEAAADSIPF